MIVATFLGLTKIQIAVVLIVLGCIFFFPAKDAKDKKKGGGGGSNSGGGTA